MDDGWSERQIDLVRRLRADGMTSDEIRLRLGVGVTRTRIARLIHDLGLPPRPRFSSRPRDSLRIAPKPGRRTLPPLVSVQ